ncbi:hypothetical protein OEZ86_008944 [Tetradesmus obliquus]|nr:hypothetical protein OEZ86_008944 [Tetradesmus obliquus]
MEWAEMQRLLGVAQVTLYAFNPAPLLQPLLEWYQAQGFFQLLEWIIPASILKDQSQPCALPWFHASTARQRFGAPPCTYHQDNYQIGWWGQTLAVQDCTYRAMAAGHRWVAVMDLDEFLQQRVAAAVTAAAAAGDFEVWFAADQRLANLYGGHQLKGWAAPK